MSNRLAPARPLVSLTALAFLYIISAVRPACSQTEAQPGTVSREPASTLASVSVHRRKQHEGYLVDVTYPQFKGDNEPNVALLNRKAKSIVNANIPNKPGEMGGINYEYICSFENQFVSKDLVSSRFEFYKDTGGAHGATNMVPFNYKVKDSVEELRLADLLGKPVDYDWLASLCFTALQQEYGDDLYDEPDEQLLKDEDFSKFTFDANGITFFFNQGDITPYAVGCPSVTLTYVELKPLLSWKSPVYKFLNRSQAHPQPVRANCAS